MAKSRFVRYLAVVWDRNAARQMQAEADQAFEKVAKSGGEEFDEGMKEGGRKAARTLTRSLQAEFKIRMARARLDLAEGTIDEKAFEREGREAASAFNRGLTGGIRRLKSTGGITDLQVAGLAGQFKRTPGVGRAGVLGGLALGGLAGPLAGILSISSAVSGGQAAIEVADRYDAALRKLEGTAKLTGESYGSLADSAERVQEQFQLAPPIAADLTAVATRLAAKTGDVGQANQFLTKWMDLAAAAGLDAQAAMEQLEVTFRGQDEGLNRLGLANPAEIYKKWGAGADEASKAQAIVNEVMAEGAKAVGTYNDFLESNRGLAQEAANEQERLAAEMGESLQPARVLGNEMKTGLLAALTGIAREVGTIAKWINRAMEIELNLRTRINGADVKIAEWLQALNGINAMSAGRRIGNWLQGRRGGGGTAPMSAADLAALDAAIATPTVDRDAPIRPPLPPLPTPAEQEAARKAEQARVAAMNERLAGIPARWGGPDGRPEASGIITEPIDAANESWEEYLDVVQRANEISQEAAYQMASAFQDAFQLMADEGANLGNFLEGIARGIAGAMLAGLAQFAQGKIAENIAAAIEAAAYALGFTSHGNFASAAAAWASAGQHTAAAVAWGALAGGAGAGRSAITGGAGGIPPSTRDAGLGIAERAVQEPAPINIWIDPLDPGNPVHAKAVGAGMDLNVRLGGVPVWARGRR